MEELDGALVDALRRSGIDLDDATQNRLRAHLEVLREWQPRASLVSEPAMDRLWSDHVTDSLTLTPELARLHERDYHWWDIGSGGGFPALTGKAVLPRLPLLCWERSENKAQALRAMVERMGGGAEIEVEDFQGRCVHADQPIVLTARAVEKAERVQRNIARFMREDDVFLCQRLPNPGLFPSPMFHVEHLEDAFSTGGWRRGTLHRITRGPGA